MRKSRRRGDLPEKECSQFTEPSNRWIAGLADATRSAAYNEGAIWKPLFREIRVADANSLPVDDDDAERKKHITELISTIKESADKLASDAASRGDLKIIS